MHTTGCLASCLGAKQTHRSIPVRDRWGGFGWKRRARRRLSAGRTGRTWTRKGGSIDGAASLHPGWRGRKLASRGGCRVSKTRFVFRASWEGDWRSRMTIFQLPWPTHRDPLPPLVLSVFRFPGLGSGLSSMQASSCFRHFVSSWPEEEIGPPQPLPLQSSTGGAGSGKREEGEGKGEGEGEGRGAGEPGASKLRTMPCIPRMYK